MTTVLKTLDNRKMYQCQFTKTAIEKKVGIPEQKGGKVVYRGCYRDWNCVLAKIREMSVTGKMTTDKRVKLTEQIIYLSGDPDIVNHEAPSALQLASNGLDWFFSQYTPNNNSAMSPDEEKAIKDSIPKKRMKRKFTMQAEEWKTPKLRTIQDICFERRWDPGMEFPCQFISDGANPREVAGIKIMDPNTESAVCVLFDGQ